MDHWKITVTAPYFLFSVWIIISILVMFNSDLGGVVIGAAYLSWGVILLLGYSIILGIALLLKRIIHKK